MRAMLSPVKGPSIFQTDGRTFVRHLNTSEVTFNYTHEMAPVCFGKFDPIPCRLHGTCVSDSNGQRICILRRKNGDSDAHCDFSVSMGQLLSFDGGLTLPCYDSAVVNRIISNYGSTSKGAASMMRAKYIFSMKDSPTRIEDATPKTSSVFTLCGDGSNCSEAGKYWRTVTHFDFDPVIVGHMRCMGHTGSIYTNGSPTTFKRSGPIGWEDVVTKPNPMFTPSMKRTVKVGYADYDGGPLSRNGKQMIPLDVFVALPNMVRFGLTVSKRRRGKDVSYTNFINLPDNWRLTKTFGEGGVICWVFDFVGKRKLPSDDPTMSKTPRGTRKRKSIPHVGGTFEYESTDGSGPYKAKLCKIDGDELMLKGSPFGRYVVRKDDLTIL